MRFFVLLLISFAGCVDADSEFAVLRRLRSAAKSSSEVAVLDKLTSLIEKGVAFKVEQGPPINCSACNDDQFCLAICQFRKALPDIEKFVFDQHDNTKSEIETKVGDLETKSGDAVSKRGLAIDADTTWATCTQGQYSLAEVADNEYEDLVGFRATREDECDEGYETWDEFKITVDIDDFSCSLEVEGKFSCENTFVDDWNSSLYNHLFYPPISKLDGCIKANDDVEQAETDYDNAIQAHKDRVGVCNGNKDTRQTALCTTLKEKIELYCVAKRAYESLIQDVDTAGNVFSYEDRTVECRGIRALDCVMKKITDALEANNTDFELSETTLTDCQAEPLYQDCDEDFKLSDEDRKVQEFQAAIAEIDCDGDTLEGLSDVRVYDGKCTDIDPPHSRSPWEKLVGTCYTLDQNRTVDLTWKAAESEWEFSTCG